MIPLFSSTMMSFIVLNIYVLLLINGLLVSTIFFTVVKDKLKRYRYNKAYGKLQPIVLRFLQKGDNVRKIKTLTSKKYNFNVVLDIMVEYTKKNNIEIISKFETINSMEHLLKKAKQGIDLNLIRKFALIKSPKAYDILMEWSDSEDFEEKYPSFYALSLLKLEKNQIYPVINKLINSNISRDRQIEILNNFNLSIEEYFHLLSKQQTDLGKVVLLRVLQSKREIQQENYSERIIPYLIMDKEVRISGVLTLATSRNLKYLPLLVDIYKKDIAWEVRASIAKSLINFPPENIIEVLKQMIYDQEWWVRFNAFETLAMLGEEGINILIDLSLDTSNEKVSNLAYYMLNSNKHVFNTMKNY